MNICFDVSDTDLHNVIKRGNILKDVHKRYIMYQLLKSTKYLHSGNVIHRDQKVSVLDLFYLPYLKMLKPCFRSGFVLRWALLYPNVFFNFVKCTCSLWQAQLREH